MRGIGIAIALVGAGLATTAVAQDYPSAKPIRMMVPTGAGGNQDLTVRLYADKMGEILNQKIIVENRPGASGVIGVQAVLGSPADGYTILSVSPTFVSVPKMAKTPSYDALKDFQGIGFTNAVPLAVLVSSSKPDKTIQDLIARAKAKPNSVSYAHAGVGTSTHIPAVLFALEAGIQVVDVPYKGNGPAFADVLSGRVDFIFNSLTNSIPQAERGDARILAISTAKRSSALPNVPTLDEIGLKGYDQSLYTGLAVRAGTPPAIVAKLHDALNKAMAAPDLRKRALQVGVELNPSASPEEFQAFLARESARYERIARETGIRIE